MNYSLCSKVGVQCVNENIRKQEREMQHGRLCGLISVTSTHNRVIQSHTVVGFFFFFLQVVLYCISSVTTLLHLNYSGRLSLGYLQLWKHRCRCRKKNHILNHLLLVFSSTSLHLHALWCCRRFSQAWNHMLLNTACPFFFLFEADRHNLA